MGSVLLVESDSDGPDGHDRLGPALRQWGHEVIVAQATDEALARLGEGGIDAIVVDSYDPRIGVVELSRAMNALPDVPPLVLVSASPHAPEISVRIGAAAFVAKPCEPGELAEVVRRLVGELRPVRVIEDLGDDEPTGPARQLG